MEEDRLYLKKFVQQHPENKMGWYLLGKEYVAQGKDAKAAYCFAQAGEVYEAYEAKKINVKLPEHLYMEGAPNGEQTAASRSKWTNKWRFAMLLLILALLSTVATAPESWRPRKEEPAAVVAAATDAAVFYTHAFSNPLEKKNALQTIFFPQRASWKYAVLAKGVLSADGKWVLWPKKPVIELTSERSDITGQPDVAYYDDERCNCKPGDSTKAKQTTESWMAVEEELAVLRSSLIAYSKQNEGALPESIEKLSGDYPRNVLPGFTETMKQAYPAIAAQLAQGKPAGDSGGSSTAQAQPEKTAAENHYGNTPLEEKLEIVVDKENHRLALVSGKIIIRNYAVGLGGDKTPEQTFVISEKVRNPNGRSNGDFGSRGMTLSDTLFAIHGTNDPTSIGKDKSLGCIRMRKEDVEELFDMVPIGTKVTIGQGGLPAEESIGEVRFKLEPLFEETNPRKVYRWLK
ncbi:L,D-transpeptidase family protein [Paenibacillus sp. MBLB4367]|uniref:L,D-transpeptidase family protein n=1 Tax=Paenibacillus sp. MBLB4367 TaxID=3384767 RepID=UPI0039082219